MIMEALKYLFDAGYKAREDARSIDLIQDYGDGLYADKEGGMADALNREIERRALTPADVERRDTATDVASFVAMVATHKSETTEVFVGPGRAVAVLAMEGWRQHVIVLPLERSPSWNFWAQRQGFPAESTADEMAPFVDYVKSGETLLSALSGLEWVSENSTRTSHSTNGLTIKATSGDHAIDLPNRVDLDVPVYAFNEDDVYPMSIRLTARMESGRRMIVLTPIGAPKAEHHARECLLTEIRAGLEGVPVHSGVPQLGLKP